MDLRIERRAEIALRSLQARERGKILAALTRLQMSSITDLRNNPKLYPLKSTDHDRRLFVYKGTEQLRLILSIHDDICVLEDIIDHARIDQLIKREGQE